jgi:hypothetical protein
MILKFKIGKMRDLNENYPLHSNSVENKISKQLIFSNFQPAGLIFFSSKLLRQFGTLC